MKISGQLITMPQGTPDDVATGFSVNAPLQLYGLMFDDSLLPQVRSLVGKMVDVYGSVLPRHHEFGGSFQVDKIEEMVIQDQHGNS